MGMPMGMPMGMGPPRGGPPGGMGMNINAATFVPGVGMSKARPPPQQRGRRRSRPTKSRSGSTHKWRRQRGGERRGGSQLDGRHRRRAVGGDAAGTRRPIPEAAGGPHQQSMKMIEENRIYTRRSATQIDKERRDPSYAAFVHISTHRPTSWPRDLPSPSPSPDEDIPRLALIAPRAHPRYCRHSWCRSDVRSRRVFPVITVAPIPPRETSHDPPLDERAPRAYAPTYSTSRFVGDLGLPSAAGCTALTFCQFFLRTRRSPRRSRSLRFSMSCCSDIPTCPAATFKRSPPSRNLTVDLMSSTLLPRSSPCWHRWANLPALLRLRGSTRRRPGSA